VYEIVPKLNIQDVLRYAIAYLFWLLAGLLALLVIFASRAALNALWPAMNLSRWLLRPIDRFGLVFMSLLWLVYVIFCEHYYRSSITKVRLRRSNVGTSVTLRAEDAEGGRFTKTLTHLGLDILARRLVPTLGIPLIVLGLAYLVYQLSWVMMSR
jgi:uncharacterized membrane protein